MSASLKEHFLRYLEARGIRLTQSGLVESIAPFVGAKPFHRCCYSATPFDQYTPEELEFAARLEHPWTTCWLKPSEYDVDDFPWHYELNGIGHPLRPDFICVTRDNQLTLCRVPSPSLDGKYMSDIRAGKRDAFIGYWQTLREAGLVELSNTIAGS